jgi:hypothetical protein
MKPFLIEFTEKINDWTDVKLDEYRMMFPDYDKAQEWALLTAQTSNIYKHLQMNIRVSQISKIIKIYYNGQE